MPPAQGEEQGHAGDDRARAEERDGEGLREVLARERDDGPEQEQGGSDPENRG